MEREYYETQNPAMKINQTGWLFKRVEGETSLRWRSDRSRFPNSLKISLTYLEARSQIRPQPVRKIWNHQRPSEVVGRALRKEQMLKVKHGGTIKDTDQVNDMIFESIKAKLSILEEINS